MDRDIYGKIFTRNDYGVYATRRYPKGSGSAPSVGPTSPTDPNANPVTVVREYAAAAVVPHAAVERWTYTVPPKRRAVIQSAMVGVLRDTAAATPNGVTNVIAIQRAGSPAGFTFIRTHTKLGTLGDKQEQVHSGPVELFEGDRVWGMTLDVSVDGTNSYESNVHLIEYDNLYPPVGGDYHKVVGANPSSPSGSGGAFIGSSAGGSGGGVIIRSESPRDSVNWINLGGGYYQRR